MSTFLSGIAKKAHEQPKHRSAICNELPLNEAYLKECWRDIRKDAAYGVDWISAEDYDATPRMRISMTWWSDSSGSSTEPNSSGSSTFQRQMETAPLGIPRASRISCCNSRSRESLPKPSTSRIFLCGVAMGIVQGGAVGCGGLAHDQAHSQFGRYNCLGGS